MQKEMRIALGIALVLWVAPTTSGEPQTDRAAAEIQIDRSLSAAEIDPAVYFLTNDPTDPYAGFYAEFRARRARDMNNPAKPRPIEPYQAVHAMHDKPWSSIEAIFPFDWSAIGREAPAPTAAFKSAVKSRLALDHPDLKIIQLMLGPGATLPAHADGAPGFFHVVGGSGEITVEGRTQTATPGTTASMEPYDVRRARASTEGPLKILWFRWAPDGDQAYLAAGYYLTGANQHIQPKEATLPDDFQYWGVTYTTEPVTEAGEPTENPADAATYASQREALTRARADLGAEREKYPDTEVFSHESSIGWLDEETLKKAKCVWAKDVRKLGGLLDRWSEVMRYKGIFQARRPGGGWDINVSEMVWGPHARYVEHSHSIPEFYYMMSGPVEHWVDGTKYVAMPGDIFLTNSYVSHQSRGIVDAMPFRNISGSWAPNGDRSVFRRPFYLLEPLPEQPAGAALGENPDFH